MTVRLRVRSAIWRSQVARTVSVTDGLIPVVKGNGYGFGRVRLAEIAAEFCDTVAVGTVHELDGLPDSLTPVVLTPTLVAPTRRDPVLTVGNDEHVAALKGWSGRVVVKLATDLRRFGGSTALVDRARAAGLDVVGVAVHPPIAGTDADRVEQIDRALVDVDPSLPAWVSHLGLEAYRSLPATRRYRIRVGTALWHGDKSALHLDADVLDVRRIAAGASAGYHQARVPADGHLVMIGAGTANGVTPLSDGRSPFHFERTRLALHEGPHMHTSMAFVPEGDPLPGIGDHVDVQRPLHMTGVDEYRWD
ncbi:alanine racemase [Ilumatobacter nonamiensis]|uniref:alanine racemase n=1 Tax=Ilumatobacter nonamiensis TaxID=467093 RepID=UPI000590AE0B|nr:alanine racemase [Ilumatobacter nonamiensis]